MVSLYTIFNISFLLSSTTLFTVVLQHIQIIHTRTHTNTSVQSQHLKKLNFYFAVLKLIQPKSTVVIKSYSVMNVAKV